MTLSTLRQPNIVQRVGISRIVFGCAKAGFLQLGYFEFDIRTESTEMGQAAQLEITPVWSASAEKYHSQQINKSRPRDAPSRGGATFTELQATSKRMRPFATTPLNCL